MDSRTHEPRAAGRAMGACARAGLAAALVAAPHLLVGGQAEATPLVAFFALLAAAFVGAEYAAPAPSLVEFRDAPPFNRLRFVAVGLTILALAPALAQQGDDTLSLLLRALGDRLGEGADLPGSPVRLLLTTLPEGAEPRLWADLRLAGAVAYGASLATVAAFALALRLRGWPRAFNVWVNLPRFDPSAGGCVVDRLHREANVNLLLGITLPFLAPMAAAVMGADPSALVAEPAVLIWTVVTWAFFPASLVMRGVALARVARTIAAQRAHAGLALA